MFYDKPIKPTEAHKSLGIGRKEPWRPQGSQEEFRHSLVTEKVTVSWLGTMSLGVFLGSSDVVRECGTVVKTIGGKLHI